MMKQILHRGFLWLAVALLAATACVEPIANDNPYKASVPVRFKVVTSDGVPVATKSAAGLISGEDAAVTALYLYCFDENGRYLGRYNATDVTSTYATNEPDDEGTFNGSVPPATARIHFVANADIPVGNDKVGMTEEEIFHGQDAATWGLTACLRNTIAYWGYHKEATAEAMANLFDPDNSSTTTIYLLRDRARIEAGTFDERNNPTFDPATVMWTIYNGLSTGYVAPYSTTTRFEGYYSNEGGNLVSTSTLTPQANPARDVTNDDDLRPFSSSSTTGRYMYAFEDRNLINGNDVSGAIRIIVKVNVKNDPTQVYYFPVRLTDSEGNDQLHITRGHRYGLNLGPLPIGLGYPTFAEAAAATSFANGQLISIPMVVPEVSDGRFQLRVDYKLGEDELTSTSVLYEEWPGDNPVVRIPFQFVRTDGSAVSADDFNFTASWSSDGQTVADEDYDTATEGIKIITTDITNGGDGYVEIKLNPVEVGNLKSGVIRLLDKKNKLERNIYIYSIKWFRYRDLQLVQNGTGYRLYLQLPSGERFSEYPEGLYPIKLRIATKSLRPSAVWNGTSYQNMTQKPAEDVVFGVEVRSTGADVPSITYPGTAGTWNYQNPQWNFWYTYTITEKENPYYWIDFTDIRSSYAAANRPGNVGLYFRIEFFGDGEGGGAAGKFGGHSLASEAIPLTAKDAWVDPDTM